MFSDELEKISWEETTKAIYSKTNADVRRALGKSGHLDVNDFMALICPPLLLIWKLWHGSARNIPWNGSARQSPCSCRFTSPIHVPILVCTAVSISVIR